MNNEYNIPNQFFSVDCGEKGMSWTLATLTGHMLTRLEERYGPRDHSWTFIGVEFWEGGPMTWYPGSHLTPHPRHVAVRLGAHAYNNHKEAMYQLSHECVHLLAPSGQSGAPVIEEGLAYLYSREILERHFGHDRNQPYGSAPAYETAAKSVLQLLQCDNHAIYKLREKEPAFYRMTAQTFTQADLKISPHLIAELLKPF